MKSPPTQLSFYGNDVIAYVIPSKVQKNFQPIGTKQILDITLDQNSHFSKMSIKKLLNFLELLNKKKNFMCDFLNDEIDVDSCFFHNFLDVYVVQNGVLGLSKGFLGKLRNLLNQRVYF